MTTQSVKEETAMASDWSGKLVIKARLGDDVRIIPIHNEDITFDELILMMQRVYRGTLTSSDDITIKYQDDDGDLITMFDCADLSYALHTSKVLKITIFPASEKKPLVTEDGVAVRNELVEINKKVSRLIECLEADKRIKEASVEVVKPVEAASGRLSALPVAMNEGKEFDPLSNASQQMNGLAQTGSIPGSSRGSVDSHAGGSYAPPVQKPTPLSGQQQQQQAQQQQQQQQQQFPQQQSFPPQQPPQQQPTQQQSQQQQPQQPPQQQQQQPYQQQQQHQPPYGHPSSHSKASQPPPSNNPNYPPHQASYLHNAPPSAGASASYSNNPPSNNPSYPSNPAYPNTSVPSFQPPQPVQTGIPGAPYTPYGQYKGPQSTGNYQQPPQPQQPNFYPQTGLPPQPSPSGGNPYSRGSGGPGQYPRPQYPTSH